MTEHAPAPIAFKRVPGPCPKCGGKVKRHYCTGKYGDCGDYFSPIKDMEHFDLHCQECGYTFYQKVK